MNLDRQTTPESVWDYPRPPRVERDHRRVTVRLGTYVFADTVRALRVLETSHPPVLYLPLTDVDGGCLRPSSSTTWCEFKGHAVYWSVEAGGITATDGAWSYPTPADGYEALRDHIAFYPAAMTECTVAGERVRPQAGGFYGGWITSDVAGPFKGEPGTLAW